MLAIPYIIQWLVMKDFLNDTNFCDTFNETGYCLSELQCNDIVKGIRIGTCENGTLGSTCCKITMNYFNETYLLNPLFVIKSQTETAFKAVLFSANKHSRFKIQYGNKSISSDRKVKVILYNPAIHVCESPDRIFWPIMAHLSRRSRHFRKQNSGVNQLYAVTLDKLDSDEHNTERNLDSSCPSKSDETDDQFKLLINPEETFDIRKFLSPKTQRNSNLTVDMRNSSDEAVEPENRNRRSLLQETCKQEDSIFEKQQLEGADNLGNRDVIVDTMSSQLEESLDIQKEINSYEGNLLENDQDIDLIRNQLLESTSMLKQFIEMHEENNNAKLTSDKQKGEVLSDELSPEKSMHELSKERSDSPENAALLEVPLLTDAMLIEDFIFSRHFQSYVNNSMKSAETDATHYMQNPVQSESAHEKRTPVQNEDFHDFRRPVQKDTTHDMRRPVEIHSDHNMRKSVQTTRNSVQREITHDLGKPVVSNESHDLRWPVVEDETNLPQSKNSYSINADRKVDSNTYKMDDEENLNQTLHKLYADCKMSASFGNKNSSVKSPSENEDNQSRGKLSELWNEASTVCGKDPEAMEEMDASKMKGKWPWMVSLQEKISRRFSHKCSASLLNSLWVVTVAHCVDMKPKSDLQLVLGNQDSENGYDKANYTAMAIGEIIVHPKFNRIMFENDVALLRMKNRVAFKSTISPICLPWSDELKRNTADFIGWELKYQQTSGGLEKLAMPVMASYECDIYSASKNKEKIKDTFLCADKNDTNCDSESGGPLTVLNAEGRWSLMGLVSWGNICTNPEQSGVYVRISSYSQWITDVIKCYESFM